MSKKKISPFILITPLFLILGCQTPIERDIEGSWVLDKIQINGVTEEGIMTANLIIFEKNGVVNTPFIHDGHNQPGKWNIELKGASHKPILNIVSADSLFNGKYYISVCKDEAYNATAIRLRSATGKSFTLYYWLK